MIYLERVGQRAREARITKAARLRSLVEQRRSSRELAAILKRYQEQVAASLRVAYPRTGVVLSSIEESILAQTLRGHALEFTGNIRNYMQSAIISSAEQIALREGSMVALSVAEVSPQLAAAIAAPFATDAFAARTFQILWDTALGNQISLSDKVWAMGEYTNGRVSSIIRAGIQAGEHPTLIAKALETEIVPGPRGVGNIWSGTRGPERLRGLVSRVPASIRTRRGTVAYNYLRVARTETFRAQRAAHLLRAQFFKTLPRGLDPIHGIQWNLSASHPEQDICDEWATDDKYNLGGGVYPQDAVPFGHPNDICYTSSVMLPAKDFKKKLDEFVKQTKQSEAALAATINHNAGTFLSYGGDRALLVGNLAKSNRVDLAALRKAARRGLVPGTRGTGLGFTSL